MLSGCRNSLSPSTTCFTAFAPGTTAPSTAVVRKMRLPQTIGDECERPSIGVFHLMFFVGLHSDGRFFSFEIPEPSGPRHCGQLPADALLANEPTPATTRAIITTSAIRYVCFTASILFFKSALSAAYFSPNAYKFETVRTINNPSEIAGVAIITSPTGFFASNSYFGPALTTNTSPSSLEK